MAEKTFVVEKICPVCEKSTRIVIYNFSFATPKRKVAKRKGR